MMYKEQNQLSTTDKLESSESLVKGMFQLFFPPIFHIVNTELISSNIRFNHKITWYLWYDPLFRAFLGAPKDMTSSLFLHVISEACLNVCI